MRPDELTVWKPQPRQVAFMERPDTMTVGSGSDHTGIYPVGVNKG